MDVWGLFIGDSTITSGGVMRTAIYRDYEQFPYGTLEQNSMANSKDPYSKVEEKSQKIQAEKTKKIDCPFCKEHKKRPLINYLRNRDLRQHHESICEDEENCS